MMRMRGCGHGRCPRVPSGVDRNLRLADTDEERLVLLGHGFLFHHRGGRHELRPGLRERLVAAFDGRRQGDRAKELRVRRMVEERREQRVEIGAPRILGSERARRFDSGQDRFHG